MKQRNGSELRSRTLDSVKPESSQALKSLLDELHTSDEAKIFHSAPPTDNHSFVSAQCGLLPKPRAFKSYPLCQQAGCPDFQAHFLSSCKFLPEPDRLFVSKLHQVVVIELDESSFDYQHSLDQAGPSYFQEFSNMQHCPSRVLPAMESPITCRINVSQSPFLHAFHSHHPLHLTIDTGAETNMMRASLVRHIGAKVTKSSQTTLQADGRTPLAVAGETHIPLICHGIPLSLEALIVEDLDVDILAGMPFTTSNDITVRHTKLEIIITGCDVASYMYGCSQSPQTYYAVRACHLLHTLNTNTTVWQGELT